jgi:N-carbamoylputrescine amidase
MTSSFEVITHTGEPLPSLFHVDGPYRAPIRVGAVQCAWNSDPALHEATLREGVALAAEGGASIVLLQELTLSPYFCWSPNVPNALERFGEDLETGPTSSLARTLATEHGVAVHISLYERVGEHGFNTAICVDHHGDIVARTRKTHIPEFPYYHENEYFAYSHTEPQVTRVAGADFAFPTCWDQWFPELARCLSMDGAEVIVYPTAIGSEPQAPDADTQPMWQQMIAANGLANATFMIAVNRIGTEGPLTFYGSSFISDPYGRVLTKAPRDRAAVMIADLHLGQRRDWLSFGLMYTRRPERYGRLHDNTELGRPPIGVPTGQVL